MHTTDTALIAADVIETGEVLLGERLVALLEEGGLKPDQAEQVRAELQKAGFGSFRRHRDRNQLASVDAATVERLVLRAQDRFEEADGQNGYTTHLWLRQAWLVGKLAESR